MIANYKEEGWQVITQRAHGLLAAQLALHWKESERPSRWTETLLAIAEHDDAENELDGEALLTDAGGPLNFSMKQFDLVHCRKLASLTITKSRYIALLTSLHMEFVYGRFAKTDPECRSFLAEQKKLRTSWCRELKLPQAELMRIYNLMEWCDACSLLLCQGALQPERRKVEISTGPTGKMHYLTQLDEGRLTIEPWPFAEERFEVRFESRLIAQLQFDSSEAFRQAFLAAEPSETVWTLEQARVRKKAEKVPKGRKL